MVASNRYREIEQWLNRKIASIDNIELDEFKCLCMYSLLERFAQEWAGYPTQKSEDVFCDFVIANQVSATWLEDVNPITLYYNFKNRFCSQYTLDDLDDDYKYDVSSITRVFNVKEMINTLKQTGVHESSINKHQYIHLLYKMRNKLSHEGGLPLGTVINSQDFLPSFINITSEKNEKEWHFGFSYDFLKSLTLECIHSFFKKRMKAGLDPFENNTMDREHILSWMSYHKEYIKP